MTINGIPDGAWFVDCSVDTSVTPGTAPAATAFEVGIQTTVYPATLTTSSETIESTPAQAPGHLVLGAIYPPHTENHDNSLRVVRAGFWMWYACNFKPV